MVIITIVPVLALILLFSSFAYDSEATVVYDDGMTHDINTSIADFVEVIGMQCIFNALTGKAKCEDGATGTTLIIQSDGSVLAPTSPGAGFGRAAVRVGSGSGGGEWNATLIVKEGATITGYSTSCCAGSGITWEGENWLFVEGGNITGGSATYVDYATMTGFTENGHGIELKGPVNPMRTGESSITGGAVVPGRTGTALYLRYGASISISGGHFGSNERRNLIKTQFGKLDQPNLVSITGGSFERLGRWELNGPSRIDIWGCIEYNPQCGDPYGCSLTGVLSDGSPIDVRVLVEGEGSQVQIMSTCAPTMSPAPTEQPSEFPSMLPALSPSALPSTLPSGSPSKAPTIKPSSSPSNLPSISPSWGPTTDGPSLVPTSDSPSIGPSAMASESPSTSNPSMVPSDNPSSIAPSLPPTMYPSIQPSLPPTNVADVIDFTTSNIFNNNKGDRFEDVSTVGSAASSLGTTALGIGGAAFLALAVF